MTKYILTNTGYITGEPKVEMVDLVEFRSDFLIYRTLFEACIEDLMKIEGVFKEEEIDLIPFLVGKDLSRLRALLCSFKEEIMRVVETDKFDNLILKFESFDGNMQKSINNLIKARKKYKELCQLEDSICMRIGEVVGVVEGFEEN